MLKELHSEEEMVAFGEELGKGLSKGDVLLLTGPLGVGKTTLAKGILSGLAGIDPLSVQSPTYAYVHPYQGRFPIYHFDLYRLEKEQTFFDLDLDAYLSDQSVALIEWPERVPSLSLSGRTIGLTISYHPKGRTVEVSGPL